MTILTETTDDPFVSPTNQTDFVEIVESKSGRAGSYVMEKECSLDFSDMFTEYYNLDDKGSTPWIDSGIPGAPHFNAHQLVFQQRNTETFISRQFVLKSEQS